MQILDNLLILTLIVSAFIAGMKLSNYYNDKIEAEKKDALQRQFVRLKARFDADDPVKPYIARTPAVLNTGDFDGDPPQPITPQFMSELKTTGRAKTTLRKSDIAK